MTRLVLPILAAALLCASCVKEKNDLYRTSELTPHFMRTVTGGSVQCDAAFTDENNALVTFESDAIMTCNGNLMSRSGAAFTGFTTYTPGIQVAISLIRAIDGTNLTDTQVVY